MNTYEVNLADFIGFKKCLFLKKRIEKSALYSFTNPNATFPK